MSWKNNRYYIDSKYIKFDENGFSISREGYDKFTKSLNRTDPKYTGIPNICFSLTSPGDSREEIFAQQRIERGFDNSETWSLYTTIAKFILPRLKAFAEDRFDYPMNLTLKGWNRRLKIMINAVELLADDKFLNEYEEYTVSRGGKLFFIWYRDLWC